MKILHAVEFYHPIHGGSQEVVKRLSEGLVLQGHDVTVATSFAHERNGITELNGVKIREFNITGKIAYGMKGDLNEYRDYVLNGGFDLIMLYAAQVWTFDALLPILHKIQAKVVLVPVGFSGLYLSEFNEYFRELPNYLKHIDHFIFLSKDYRDINFCRERGFENFSVIPNGCSHEEFYTDISDSAEGLLRKKLKIPTDDFVVLHVGSHTGVKGHSDAIKIFNMARIPNSSLVIVGNVFNQECASSCRNASILSRVKRRIGLTDRQILSVQLNRADTVDLYKISSLFLFPSNIECSPIVLFESMAARTPFLATDVGNSREISEVGLGGEIMDTQKIQSDYLYENAFGDIEDGAKRLKALYFDHELRNFYGTNGRVKWLESFTWEKITEQYESLYYSLLKQ